MRREERRHPIDDAAAALLLHLCAVAMKVADILGDDAAAEQVRDFVRRLAARLARVRGGAQTFAELVADIDRGRVER